MSEKELNDKDFKLYKANAKGVDINNNFADDKFAEFKEALKDETLRNKYHYSGYQTDKYWYTTYFTKTNTQFGLRSRFFWRYSNTFSASDFE